MDFFSDLHILYTKMSTVPAELAPVCRIIEDHIWYTRNFAGKNVREHLWIYLNIHEYPWPVLCAREFHKNFSVYRGLPEYKFTFNDALSEYKFTFNDALEEYKLLTGYQQWLSCFEIYWNPPNTNRTLPRTSSTVKNHIWYTKLFAGWWVCLANDLENKNEQPA